MGTTRRGCGTDGESMQGGADAVFPFSTWGPKAGNLRSAEAAGGRYPRATCCRPAHCCCPWVPHAWQERACSRDFVAVQLWGVALFIFLLGVSCRRVVTTVVLLEMRYMQCATCLHVHAHAVTAISSSTDARLWRLSCLTTI